MATTRENQLAFCRICTNRKFNSQRGLLCGLTDDYAKFEETCVDFEADEYEKERTLKFDLLNAGHDKASRSLDHKRNKENGGIISIIGIAMLVFCLLYLNGIIPLFISASVLVYGIRTYSRGDEQEKILEKRKEVDKKHGKN